MTTRARLLAGLMFVVLGIGSVHADLDHIKQAAENGDAAAQLELGILFQYGFNYKDNEVPALTWYTLSANQGNAKAARLRDALIGKMTSKEVEEAMEQVKSYKPPAAAAPQVATQPAAVEAAPAAPAEVAPAEQPVVPPDQPAPPPAQ